MAAIKRFFEKRKLDAKFKLAGGGHKLTDDTRSRAPVASTIRPVPAAQRELTEEKQRAADAALARLNQNSAKPSSAIRSQVKQEMLAEQKAREQAAAEAARAAGPVEVELDAHPAANVILFCCPLVGPEVLPREQMEARIEEFLLSQLPEEPEMTAALMIHTLNKNPEAMKQCIEMLGKYLDNIIEHPGEEKYQRIRAGNKVLTEKVLALRGAHEFLQAVGFEQKTIAGADGTSDDFLVLNAERASDLERLRSMKEILSIAEPIRPELDRGIRVFSPSAKATKFEVSNEFYAVSAEEIKREMEIRKEAVEKFGMLRTKEMREKDRIRELRRYRFCLIRVRFPNGILLQGTFRASEKFAAVRAFVADSLEHEWIPFALSNHLGSKLTDENLTLAELDLAPASLIQFAYDANVLSEAAAQNDDFVITSYLKKELLSEIISL